MPIYEFYCADCHTVYSFFSARVDTAAQPSCPRCGRLELPRRPSRFATLKHSGESPPESLDDLDDARLEGAMDAVLREMGDLDSEPDPHAMGRMMRRFSQVSGLALGGPMEQFITRLEAGEDPEQLEQEMENELGDDATTDQLFTLKKALTSRRSLKPRVDDTLYYL